MDNATDRAIARALERGVSLGIDGPSSACLDEETLAAWADDHLSVSDRHTVESHLAACAYCQAVAAALARALPPAPATVSRRAWVWPMAAAAVLVLGVWLGRPLFFGANGPQGAQPDSVLSRADVPHARLPESAPVAPNPPATIQESPADAAEPRAQSGRREAGAQPPAAEPVSPRNETVIDSVREERKREADTAEAAPAGAVPAPSPPAPAAPAPATSNAAPSAVPGRAASARAPAETRGTNLLPDASTARLVGADGFAVAAPGDTWRWRRTPGGIETTRDGGVTWRATDVETERAAALTAGHAPGGGVCWLVGRRGLILVTRDGTRFERVPTPGPDDLASVRATDADMAEVVSGDGRRWRTADRGRTWTVVP